MPTRTRLAALLLAALALVAGALAPAAATADESGVEVTLRGPSMCC